MILWFFRHGRYGNAKKQGFYRRTSVSRRERTRHTETNSNKSSVHKHTCTNRHNEVVVESKIPPPLHSQKFRLPAQPTFQPRAKIGGQGLTCKNNKNDAPASTGRSHSLLLLVVARNDIHFVSIRHVTCTRKDGMRLDGKGLRRDFTFHLSGRLERKRIGNDHFPLHHSINFRISAGHSTRHDTLRSYNDFSLANYCTLNRAIQSEIVLSLDITHNLCAKSQSIVLCT